MFCDAFGFSSEYKIYWGVRIINSRATVTCCVMMNCIAKETKIDGSSVFWHVTQCRFLVGPICKRQTIRDFLDCLTFEDVTDRLCRNVGSNYQPTPCGLPRIDRRHLRSLKSQNNG